MKSILKNQKLAANHKAMVFIVMGVSGCGKSTVAKQVAQQNNGVFIEADDYHSMEAKALMSAGKPLNDSHRKPWIDKLCQQIMQLSNNSPIIVMSCSSLKQKHRHQFRQLNMPVKFIFLQGSETVISKRLAQREGHFFCPSLLTSQFRALENPNNDNKNDVHTVDIEKPLAIIIAEATDFVRQEFSTKIQNKMPNNTLNKTPNKTTTIKWLA